MRRDVRLVGRLLDGRPVTLAAASAAAPVACRNGAPSAPAAQAGRRLGRIANPRARFVRRQGRRGRCDRPVWLKAKLDGDRFSYRIRRRRPCGRYTLLVRATNRAGAAEASFSRRDGNRADLRLC